MKGYSEVSIQNRGIYVAYKGEHYVVRNANTGRTDGTEERSNIKW